MIPYFLVSPSGDGWENLARDEFILNELAPGSIMLYLYINNRAVIIGCNQNPYVECNLSEMDIDDVQLVRRVSGGGAVYHDKGNLNYSFIASNDIYDEKRQNAVILNALKRFGIEAEVSGRNDITFDGLKFSGNAFCARGNNRQHHGTLLINADLSVFSKYLTPPKLKLESKGIKSVRSRVCNLTEINPSIDIEKMKQALKDSFEAEYGACEIYRFSDKDENKIDELYKKHSSWDWRIGEAPKFDIEYEGRFSFGNARVCLNVKNGLINECRVFTDSLDTEIAKYISSRLNGIRFDRQSVYNVLCVENKNLSEVASLFP